MIVEEAHLPLSPGDRCGRYTVERVVGRGGMGVVYLARDDRGHKRALKTLVFGGKLKASVVDRFKREILLLASIEHVHMVRFFDAGRLERPRGTTMWFALEYLEGQTLRQLIAARPRGVEPENVARWGRHIADGVGAAHRIHVVHRDLKPENAALHGDMVKVFDLGIAKWKGTVNTTAGGLRIGTLVYMAPEQIDPMIGEVDARTDIYALGLMLYELATGRHPLVPLDASMPADEAQMRLLVGDVAPIGPTHPGFPTDLEAVIMRCLQRKPHARFASMREVSDALEDVLLRLRTERHAASFADLGMEGDAAPASIVRRAKSASGHDATPPPPRTSDSGTTVRMTSEELLGAAAEVVTMHPSGATPAPLIQSPSPSTSGPPPWLVAFLIAGSAALGVGAVAMRKRLEVRHSNPSAHDGSQADETPADHESHEDHERPRGRHEEDLDEAGDSSPGAPEKTKAITPAPPSSGLAPQPSPLPEPPSTASAPPLARPSSSPPVEPSEKPTTTTPRPAVPRPTPKPRPSWRDIRL